MKILIAGFLVLSLWSALATHFYVCRIKGFCDNQVTVVTTDVNAKNVRTDDSLSKPEIVAQKPIPANRVIYFAFDKSEFNSGTIPDQYLEESNKYLQENQQASLSITGHTDSVGSDEYNQALGMRRAQSVSTYFEAHGVPANRISIQSMGEKDPAYNNNTMEGRAKNRRSEITIKK